MGELIDELKSLFIRFIKLLNSLFQYLLTRQQDKEEAYYIQVCCNELKLMLQQPLLELHNKGNFPLLKCEVVKGQSVPGFSEVLIIYIVNNSLLDNELGNKNLIQREIIDAEF